MEEMQRERCGCWVSVGGHDSVCFKDEGHDGDCLPPRQECMTMAQHFERQAQAIYDEIALIDQHGEWPRV